MQVRPVERISGLQRRLGAAWPLSAFLLGFPVWWLLGLTSFILVILAVPMAWHLLRLPRVVVPPGFGWWLLFLACVLCSGMMLGLTAPGTVPGSFMQRLPAFTFRFMNYVAATVAMLYAINLPERRLSTSRLIKMHAWFFLVVVIGGVLGVLLYRVQVPSLLSFVLPRSLADQRFVSTITQPSFAQVQSVLGYAAPRPAAPFSYTNLWGNNLSVLMVWFVVAYWVGEGPRRRAFCAVALVISVVPIIYSINRGLWIGLVVMSLYLALRSAVSGRVQLLVGVVLAATTVLVLVLVTPLATVVQGRLANPHSDSARSNTSLAAVSSALASPILGYGSTRPVVGSAQSIAIGRSATCPQCGNAAIGGAGQLQLLLVAQGFTGVLLYCGFFLRTLWIYRRDRSPVAVAGTLVIGLGLLYLPVYGAVGTPLALYMLAVALLWRQRRLAMAEPVVGGRAPIAAVSAG